MVDSLTVSGILFLAAYALSHAFPLLAIYLFDPKQNLFRGTTVFPHHLRIPSFLRRTRYLLFFASCRRGLPKILAVVCTVRLFYDVVFLDPSLSQRRDHAISLGPSKAAPITDNKFRAVNTIERQVSSRTDPVYTPYPLRNFPSLCNALSRNGSSDVRADTSQRKRLSNFADIELAFEILVSRYLAPWTSPNTSNPVLQRPITAKLLDSMEVILHGCAFRVRLVGDGTIRYRISDHWPQTYRVDRMKWTLQALRTAMQEYPELATIKCEFYVNVGDAPSSTMDTQSKEKGGIPLLSFRSSESYLDIPVPDPVEYGSNDNSYVWKSTTNVPFRDRIPKLVFRGSPSSLQKYHDDNWLSVPRLRIASLSREHPDLIDAGVTKWMKLGENATVHEIEQSLRSGLVEPMIHEEQGHFQFVIDIDGGLGSSRKRGLLSSGSLPFFQKSPWYQWYEPLLKPFYHYIPVETYLGDLLDRIRQARHDPDAAEDMIGRANCFAKKVLSRRAARLYWKILIQRYSQLQYDPASSGDDVKPSMCDLRPATAYGPMGCDDGWYIFNGSIPFGCKYRASLEKYTHRFKCWRDLGGGREIKYVDDPVHTSYEDQ